MTWILQKLHIIHILVYSFKSVPYIAIFVIMEAIYLSIFIFNKNIFSQAARYSENLFSRPKVKRFMYEYRQTWWNIQWVWSSWEVRWFRISQEVPITFPQEGQHVSGPCVSGTWLSLVLYPGLHGPRVQCAAMVQISASLKGVNDFTGPWDPREGPGWCPWFTRITTLFLSTCFANII